jgi:hypothetical protein
MNIRFFQNFDLEYFIEKRRNKVGVATIPIYFRKLNRIFVSRVIARLSMIYMKIQNAPIKWNNEKNLTPEARLFIKTM